MEYIHTWQQLIRENEIKQVMGKLVGDLVDAMPGKGDKKYIFRSSVDRRTASDKWLEV